MRQIKRFRDLSRRQKNRRLKLMQISKNFVLNTSNSLNQTTKLQNTTTNNSLLDEGNDDSQFDNNINNCSENIITNVVIEQSNLIHSTSPEGEHLLPDNQISLREKLILWTDRYKTGLRSLTSLLYILKTEGHDNLPNDGRSLMKTPRFTILYNRSNGYYFHYGLQNGIIDQLKYFNILIENNIIYININIDGLPIAKSSKSQLWPILAQIVSENSKPFLVGAFHGYHKPTTFNHFLRFFVKELKQLSTIGFTYENNLYYVKIRAIICDSPARAFVTCTKGHNGHFGCSKCTVEGDFENRRMLFLEQNCFLRTDESFNLRKNPRHHTGLSPFEKIPLPWLLLFRSITCIWYVLGK